MSLKAYLDNIKDKTGKTPADFRRLAEKRGLLEPGVKTGQVVSWLKDDFALGHGHAMAIVLTLKSATQPKETDEAGIAKHFAGARSRWRGPYDALLAKVKAFGPGVTVGPTSSYISFLRDGRKFAIAQVTADRMDIGLKLRGEELDSRFEAAGAWNSMVTHRVRITDPRQIDSDVVTHLMRAFARA